MTRLERIVAVLGGDLLDGGRSALVPGPGHSAHDRSVSLTLTEDGRVIVHCFSPRDDWRTVRDVLRDRGLLDDDDAHRSFSVDTGPHPVAVQPRTEDKSLRARAIWAEGRPVAGTPAETYLRRRGVRRALASPALRFHPRASALDDRRRRPALLAAIADAHGAVQGVQITLLTTWGDAKADVTTPRRVVGRLVGGAVRLDPHGDALLVAEGVETALSASEALSTPAWAALTAWNLAHFTPPDAQRLVIAADNGAAGIHAAQTLRARVVASAPATTVAITPPDSAFGDWNDWARARPP